MRKNYGECISHLIEMVGKSPVKLFGEDPEVWTALVGAVEEIPGLRSDPAHYHYERTWRVF